MKSILLAIIFLAQPVLASSPVWLVESGNNRLFLAGTIHVLRASDYPLPAAFESAYQQSQVLSFETDVGATNTPAFQSQLIQAVSLNKNQTLQSLLSAETYSQLEAHLLKNNINIQQFSHFKPSMVAMTLTLLELKKIGAGGHGVDNYYFNKATRQNKQTLALETLQQQTGFLSVMGQGQENQMIQQTLEEIKTLPKQFSSMVKNWRAGHVKQLEELFIDPMKKDYETLYQQLLVQRNLNWLPQIYNYLKTPETEMVLVGSAHLLGDDGLIKHLQQTGYKITQLN